MRILVEKGALSSDNKTGILKYNYKSIHVWKQRHRHGKGTEHIYKHEH